MNIKEEKTPSRKTTAGEKDNSFLISSKLMADLKNKGIMAFKKMTPDKQKKIWKWVKKVTQKYRGVIEAHPSNLRNIEGLPFPQEDIKLAIKLSLLLK